MEQQKKSGSKKAPKQKPEKEAAVKSAKKAKASGGFGAGAKKEAAREGRRLKPKKAGRPAAPSRQKREIFGICLFAVMVLLTGSLISYSPTDPSFNTANPDAAIRNLFGRAGALVADFFINVTLGAGAYWIPVLLIIAVIRFIQGATAKRMFLLGVSAFFLAIFSGALFSGQAKYDVFGVAVPGGGMLVGLLAKTLTEILNPAGSFLILFCGFLASLVAATGLSLTDSARVLSRLGLTGVRFGKKRLNGLGREKTKAGPTGEIALPSDGNGKSRRKRPFGDPMQEPLPFPPVINGVAHEDVGSESVEGDRAEAPLSVGDEPAPSDEPPRKPPRIRPRPVLREDPPDSKDDSFLPPAGTLAQEERIYQLPPLSLLDDPPPRPESVDQENLMAQARLVEQKLEDFGVKGRVVEVSPGPVITTYEYEPAPGVKINRITSLENDLALGLKALSVRIVGPIPGKAVVGIEVPNKVRELVGFKEMVASSEFSRNKTKLTVCLGKDIVGIPTVSDLARMPHLLIAGATGSGKSVGLNSMIASLLYKCTPDEVKFVMIDPKRIELANYDGIPHLICPVVTDPKKATNALFWAVKEMEARYEAMAALGARNITGYNQKIAHLKAKQEEEKAKKEEERLARQAQEAETSGEIPDDGEDSREDFSDSAGVAPPELKAFPYVVIVIDELADLMMVASKDVETALMRLAQMARACGIHLILATQRPSVDVLTGTIKANFPTRMAFQVSSRIDSRTILDSNGAESLLGAGDMLFMPPGVGKIQRLHGAFLSDEELGRLLTFVKEQGRPSYDISVTESAAGNGNGNGDDDDEEYDEKFDEAVEIVAETRQASISMIQRRLRIGYNRAARIIERMEKDGMVGPSDGVKPREVLLPPQ